MGKNEKGKDTFNLDFDGIIEKLFLGRKGIGVLC